MRALAALLLAVGLSGCYVYAPPPPPQGPPPMEVSFNAAQGALQDAGLTVVSADRATGVIRGTRGDVEGIIRVETRVDGRVAVQINVNDPARRDPGLSDRLTQAYNRRMGR
jgi:hypothetical protein